MGYYIVPTWHGDWSEDPDLGIAVVANVISGDCFLEIRAATS